MRKLPVLLMALLGALTAGVLAVTASSGSSHREAPLTMLDPTADDTDHYAFVPQDAPGTVTLIGDWIPFEDPAGGPNFYRFDDRATYYLNVDNTGDGKYDIRYRFKFKSTVRNPNSFLYALPGVTSFSDPKLNFVQTYRVWKDRYSNGRHVSSKLIGANVPVAPNNVGPKTFPTYDAVANQAIKSLRGGGKVFAGQVDDPFFVDLGSTFDAINIDMPGRAGIGTGNAGGGKDDLAGYNVHSIVLQVPKSEVTRDGRTPTDPKAKDAVIGTWASTDRPRLQVSNQSPVAVGAKSRTARRAQRTSGRNGDVQVSRLGNPLVNEVVIPLGMKDKFNATQPSDDLKNFGKYVLSPELAKVINILFPGLNVPENNRTDIVQALLTGIPGLTQIAPGAPPTDTLKLNLAIAPHPDPSRFGVIGGDTYGFPNGRLLENDVVDIEERVIGGFLMGNKVPLGDGVDQNDKPFRQSFPYVASPRAGFDSQIKRSEPSHDPIPADPAGA